MLFQICVDIIGMEIKLTPPPSTCDSPPPCLSVTRTQAMITESFVRLTQHFPFLWFQSDGFQSEEYPKEANAILYGCSLLLTQTCLSSALARQDLVSDPN